MSRTKYKATKIARSYREDKGVRKYATTSAKIFSFLGRRKCC